MLPAPRNFLHAWLVGLCLAGIATAQQKLEPPLITVTGEAEVRAVPDEVVFDVTVRNVNRDLKVAKAQTDESLRKVVELARRYKVAPEDMQTDYIGLEPRYRGGNETRTFLGYMVSKGLVFTLRDVTQAESLLSEIMTSGITSINSINFRTSQLRKYRDQARALAIRAAREKAIALTGEIGQKIGKAYSIEEEAATRNPASQNSLMLNSTTRSGGEAGETEGTLALGQIAVNSRITVRFILE
ncbi:MAG TPA: SIMPL domain-containing protein [Pyrinomonadaceae bacterium]|jgi:hypothetical protein